MFADQAQWLPVVFIALTGISLLTYAILDGYDLGVGVLLPSDSQTQRDTMIYSIGPFWDANETWLVLAVGLLLIAFPVAHSTILQELYIPTAIMLIALILRGVSFDFRTKAPSKNKATWDKTFKFGSLLATLTQGYMLGRYVTGFDTDIAAYGFALLSAICVTAAYCFIGSAWLIMKTEGELQLRAAKWAKIANLLMALGILSVSIANLYVNPAIFDKWINGPAVFAVAIIAVTLLFAFLSVHLYISNMPHKNDFGCWYPFAMASLIFVISFLGLAYSYFPYVVPNGLTIWQAASAPETLWVIFVGACFVLPTIVGYTIFAYRVFWGKSSALNY